MASAERLFREQGFAATTVREIAADAGVSTGRSWQSATRTDCWCRSSATGGSCVPGPRRAGGVWRVTGRGCGRHHGRVCTVSGYDRFDWPQLSRF
ncbi:TetR/AcrR family transcriptional regulator [Rhodococcus cerastii]|nr:TetR/AcrR family transcriptional regulator [Rhodococcus cerastii]